MNLRISARQVPIPQALEEPCQKHGLEAIAVQFAVLKFGLKPVQVHRSVVDPQNSFVSVVVTAFNSEFCTGRQNLQTKNDIHSVKRSCCCCPSTSRHT